MKDDNDEIQTDLEIYSFLKDAFPSLPDTDVHLLPRKLPADTYYS